MGQIVSMPAPAADEVQEQVEGNPTEEQETVSPEGGTETEGEASAPETDEAADSTDSKEETAEPAKEPLDLSAVEREKERLLAEVRALRAERRELRDKEAEKPPILVDKPADDELKDANPEDVAFIEKVLRAKGYVRKEEIQVQSYKGEVEKLKDSWLEAHPEYKPENDPNDEKWNSLNAVIRDYFKAPSNPKDIVKILDTAHSMVSPRQLPVKNPASSAEAAKKISVSSKSGGASSQAPVKQAASGKKLAVEHLKGFSDEELKELFN